jgi:shikimate kinase
VAERLLGEREVVLASGGGWAAVPGRLAALPADTESFWLKVTASTAIERAAGEPGARPLLDRGDAIAEASRLLAERDPVYREARWAVDTERSAVEDVAARILKILIHEHPETFSE